MLQLLNRLRFEGESVSTCKILLAENSGGRSKKFF